MIAGRGKKKLSSLDSKLLRKKAESIVNSQLYDGSEAFFNDSQELLHELHAHQIELELQNEELFSAQQKLISARDQYAALYDFAPIGYVTISKEGIIINANLTFATLLGVKREKLINQLFSKIILNMTRTPIIFTIEKYWIISTAIFVKYTCKHKIMARYG